MPQELPHPNQVRVLLTDRKYTAEQLAAYGERYLEGGLPNVAAMFFERAKNEAGLRKVLDFARREGDEFLMSAVARANASFVDAHDWLACAEAALAKERFLFARDAFRKAGDEDRAQEVQAKFTAMMAEADKAPRPKLPELAPAPDGDRIIYPTSAE